LAERVQADWEGRVDVHPSMEVAVFTKPDAPHPFRTAVGVSWEDGVFAFELTEEVPGGDVNVVASDRCRESESVEVLTSFLDQLLAS
jgi:hypothetical protein